MVRLDWKNHVERGKGVLDTEERIVFRDTLTACRRTRLDLASTKSDDQIRDDRVLRLTGAVGDHDTPVVGL